MEQVLQQQMKLIEQQYARTPQPPPSEKPPASGFLSGMASSFGAGVQYIGGFWPWGTTSHWNWWLDWLAEVRAIHRMFVDPRYSMSWTGRIVPLILVVLFVFPYYWVPFATLLGWIIERPVQLLVAYILVKTLQWEARRYRETAPDLPASLRLPGDGK
jgi:hypothetical protein